MEELRLSAVPAVVRADVDARPLVLPQGIRRTIDAFWLEAAARNPSLFRGTVYTVTQVERRGRGLQVTLRPTDYAHHLYTTRVGLVPEYACRVLYAAGLVRTADGRLVFGEMAEGTANAGRLQGVAGGLDASDLREGALDLPGSLRREAREELGIDLDDGRIVQGWGARYLKEGGAANSLVVLYEITLAVPWLSLRERYDAFAQAIAAQGETPEFARLVVLEATPAAVERFLAEYPRRRVDYLEPLLRAACGSAPGL